MSNFDELWPLLKELGKEVHRSEQMLVPLPQEGHFMAVRNAHIDLYFVPAGAEGPRFFLISVEKGLLFPFKPFKKFDIIAIAHLDGELVECEQAVLSDLSLLPLLEEWMIHFTQIAPDRAVHLKEEALTLLKQGHWQESVALFLEKLSSLLNEYMQEVEKKDEETLKQRDLQAEKNFESSLSEMQSVLSEVFDADRSYSRDALLPIFQKIGEAIRFPFTFPKHFPHSWTLEQKIEQICETSQIHYRKVRLRGKWWKQNMGPLLAFSEEKPYALLSGEYFLHYSQVDSTGKKRIDAETAKKFSPIAYMFYIPFPATLTKGSEVLHFLHKHTWLQWRLLLIFSSLGMLIALFPSVATYFLFKYAVAESSFSLVTYLALGLLFSSIGIPLFYFLRNYCLLKIEGIGMHLVQTALWDRLLKLAPSFFRKFSIGNLYWRVMSMDDLRVSISNANLIAVLNGAFSLFYLLIMFFFSPLLAWIALFFSLVALGLTLICAFFKERSLIHFTEFQGTIRGLSLQMILGVAKLRTAGAEKSAFAYWASLFAKSKIWQMKSQQMQNAALVIAALFPLLTFWGIYAAMVYWIGVQKLPLPDFLAFNIALSNFTLAAYPVGAAITEMVNAVPNWQRTRVILEEPLEETSQKRVSSALTGHIRFDKITFSYSSESPLVLRGVSIEVHPHEFVAIVGKSGSGKSTIARLLLGFEKPVSGSIYFDGKDLSHLDPRSIRKQIGSVLQGDRIGGGSLYDNLVCGAIFNKEQIEHALKISGFEKDLSAFPMGLNTFVPAGGETLSGGQKQRLLLARAFLSNPPILILDEATSALDNQTQEEVISYIDQLQVTRIIIAQRLKTIRNANRIYVIDNGEIAGCGTFEELASVKGLFADLVARQKL